jgi:acetylornithine/N-succinyldiaminopimelate aminotransferase
VGWNQIAEVRAAITPETAGIVIEPIQGEGGMRVASTEFLQQLRSLCDETGLLLYFDEIQCGLGRTGKMFDYEWTGVEPDVMCIAKALGNGFPIGACLATAKAASGMNPGSHGSTYGANPLAVAVAHAVLDELESPSLLAEIGRKGDLLGRGLIELAGRYPGVFKEARGQGLMRALKCVALNSEIIAKVQQAGLLTVAGSDNILRLLPPLVVSDAQIHDAVTILESVAKASATG